MEKVAMGSLFSGVGTQLKMLLVPALGQTSRALCPVWILILALGNIGHWIKYFCIYFNRLSFIVLEIQKTEHPTQRTIHLPHSHLTQSLIIYILHQCWFICYYYWLVITNLILMYIYFYISKSLYCSCVCDVSGHMQVEVKGQLWGPSSIFPPLHCFQWSKAGHLSCMARSFTHWAIFPETNDIFLIDKPGSLH